MKRVSPDPGDHQDLQDPEECQEQEATPAQLVLLALLDPLAQMASLELRESLENQGRKEMLGLQDLKAWPVPMVPRDQLALLD